ncbi:pseudouridine synthase [Circinella umbellata]|nr:pseudouridine synthase [Circinella umbellata]
MVTLNTGLRRVEPYFYHHRMHTKERWKDRSILDVFVQEFRNRSPDYYKNAIEKGWITVNKNIVSPETIVRTNDVIRHAEHFHETPITARPFCIIHHDDDLLVVDKPGGIPMHSSGRYRYNSAVEILKQALNIPRLYPINRLDRHTSGLVIMALTPERATEISQDIERRMVQKEYLCRVQGEFPPGKIVCDAPIKPISFKLSLHYVHEDGKLCMTEFERISYNGQTSVLKCRPLTGRTHQIRVHLRYLGFPIANDPMYNFAPVTPWLPPPMTYMSNSKADQVVQHLLNRTCYEQQEVQDDTDNSNSSSGNDVCLECSMLLPEEPTSKTNFGIYLHAWRYQGKGWDYKTKYPKWVHEPFHDSIVPAYM